MGELAYGDGRQTVGTRPLDREVDRGDARDLPEPQPPSRRTVEPWSSSVVTWSPG